MRWSEQRLDAAADRIDALVRLGRSAEVLGEVEDLVAAHPLRERFVGQLMTGYAAAGRTADAFARYESLRRRLADELGVDPGTAVAEVHLALLRGELGPAPAGPPAATRRSTNLRAELSSFLGRDADLARVAALLTAGRLTTIVGPGGAGKTRLAGEAAGRFADQVADGVWLVELAPVTDESSIPAAILDALGGHDARLLDRRTERPRDTAARLYDTLADSDRLLVVDNCEHLVGAVAKTVAEILALAPRVRVLATSREPLGISGEALSPLPPLGMPPPDADPGTAAGFPAVQLLVERGTAACPTFRLDAGTVADAVQIVRRLDGLPLAIELAAARMRVLPVREIAARLDDRFRLLSGGRRAGVPRHQTLRAVVEWSWELLTPAERLLAERLAVFPAGATAGSAAAVCGDPRLDPADVPDLLFALVDKSLLQVVDDGAGETRYRMLETLREYGVERLTERSEDVAARLAHARHFAALAGDLDPALRTPDQLAALRRLTEERDNILAALRVFADTGRGTEAIELVLSMCWFWAVTGGNGDAARWLQVALDTPGSEQHPLRVHAEAGLMVNAMATDQTGDATTWREVRDRLQVVLGGLDQAPPLPRRLGALAGMAPMFAYFAGDDGLAAALVRRALAAEDPWVRAMAHLSRASNAENTGDIGQLRADVVAAYPLFVAVGDRWGQSMTLTVRGYLRTLDGDLDGAADDYRQALEYIGLLGAPEDALFLQLRLSDVHSRRGDPAAARQVLADAKRSSTGLTRPADRILFAETELATLTWLDGDLAVAERSADSVRERLAAQQLPVPMHGHMTAIICAATAVVAVQGGRLEQARADLELAYRMGVGSEDQPIIASVGVAVAWLAAALDRPADAAAMVAAAAVLRGAEDPTDRALSRLVDTLRAALGDAGYDRAVAAGRVLDREGAIARIDPSRLD